LSEENQEQQQGSRRRGGRRSGSEGPTGQSQQSQQSAPDHLAPAEGDAAPRREVDETANPHVYLADIGETLTSHGDGTPTIAPELERLAAEEAERNADPDRANREVARSLGADV
jgi:hypothetical protein